MPEIHFPFSGLFGLLGYPSNSSNPGPLEIGDLVWTSTSADLRPTFNLEDVLDPTVGDELLFIFNGEEYSTTITYEHLYKLKTPFPELPELPNGTYSALVKYSRDEHYVFSNNVSVTINVAYTAPVIAADPVISRVGSTFTCVPASVTGRLTPTSTYQWYRDASPISGETALTYDVTLPDDEGTTITCVHTATNSEGLDSATSNGIEVPVNPWVLSTVNPAIVNKSFASSTHTFTGVDFEAGLGIVMVAQNNTGRTITGVTVNGNAATLVVASGAVHYASMWKCNVATPGNYDVVVTGSTTFGLVGIATGTIVGVDAAETDTAVLDYSTGNQPHSTSSSLTVPSDGIGIVIFMGRSDAATTWSVGTEEVDKNTGGSNMTISTARLESWEYSTATPTITTHAYAGTAMVAAAWGP